MAEAVGVTFSDSAPVPKFWNPGPIILKKFENPTPVQTPATAINATEIQQFLLYRNDMYKDHADSCCCRKSKVTPGPVFEKFLTPVPKEKRTILQESTPALRNRGHLCHMVA